MMYKKKKKNGSHFNSERAKLIPETLPKAFESLSQHLLMKMALKFIHPTTLQFHSGILCVNMREFFTNALFTYSGII